MEEKGGWKGAKIASLNFPFFPACSQTPFGNIRLCETLFRVCSLTCIEKKIFPETEFLGHCVPKQNL